MVRPRILPPEKRKEEIIQATRAILVEKGFQDLCLEDVAKKAKVAKGTLYLYFKSKETLFLDVVLDSVRELENQLEALSHEGTPLDVLGRMASVQLAFFIKNRDFIIQLSHQKPGPWSRSAQKIMKECLFNHLSFFSKYMKRGIQTKTFRSKDPVQLGLFWISLQRMFALYETERFPNKTVHQLGQELMVLFCRGAGVRNA